MEIVSFNKFMMDKLLKENIIRIKGIMGINEDFTDRLLSLFKLKPYKEFQRVVNTYMNLQRLRIEKKESQFIQGTDIFFYDENNKPVIKVLNGFNKQHELKRIMFVKHDFMQKIENLISQKGLVVNIMEWVKNKINEPNIEEWEYFTY